MYSGENEIDANRRSLRKQTNKNWKQATIEGLSNEAAHRHLYRLFTERQPDFDLFVKLDADMVFASECSLELMVGLFERFPELDHAVLPVRDWASGLDIHGIHVFSDRVSWNHGDDQLFVDRDPVYPGKKLAKRRLSEPLVLHSPDPSPWQAFRFGAHRALKMLQRERKRLRLHRSRNQWRLLLAVSDRVRRDGDRRRGLVLAGADRAVRGEVDRDDYADKGSGVREVFERDIADSCLEDLLAQIGPLWNGGLSGEMAYLTEVGAARVLSSVVSELPKRALLPLYRRLSGEYLTRKKARTWPWRETPDP